MERIPMVRLTKKTLAAPIAMAVGVAVTAGAAQAQDGFRFYGFLNPGYLSVDDGVGTTSGLYDNSNAPSRIGMWYETQMQNGTLKFNFETALGFRGTSSANQTSTPDSLDWGKTSLRKVEAIYVTDTAGTFYFGQGSMASDGITGGTDMSGTGLSGTVAEADTAGSFQFRTAGGALSGITVSDVFKDFDGGRKGRARYDTPEFGGGFIVSAAVGKEILKDDVNDTYYDLALRYGKDFGDTTVKATLAYAVTDTSGGDVKAVIGSVGAKHKPTGLNGTLTVGDQDNTGDYVYAKVGLQRDWFAIGTTSLSVDAFQSNDMVTSGDKGVSLGFEAVQQVKATNMEVYFGYHQHAYDATGTVYQDINAYMLGARWSF